MAIAMPSTMAMPPTMAAAAQDLVARSPSSSPPLQPPQQASRIARSRTPSEQQQPDPPRNPQQPLNELKQNSLLRTTAQPTDTIKMPPKRKSHLTGLQGLGPAEIKDDLIAMGLGKERVDEIMEKKDTADPSISPPRPFETQGRAQRQQRVGKGKGKKPAYEPLCLAKNKSSSPLLVPLIHIASC
jgi:hypothetical protein